MSDYVQYVADKTFSSDCILLQRGEILKIVNRSEFSCRLRALKDDFVVNVSVAALAIAFRPVSDLVLLSMTELGEA